MWIKDKAEIVALIHGCRKVYVKIGSLPRIKLSRAIAIESVRDVEQAESRPNPHVADTYDVYLK